MKHTELSDLTTRMEHNSQARDAVKYAMFLASGRGLTEPPPQELAAFSKGAVVAATTGTDTALRRLYMALVNVIERKTALGQLVGTVPTPPFSKVAALSNEPIPAWVAEGNPAPTVRFTSSTQSTEAAKFAVLVGLTEELVRHADDRATSFIERVLVRAMRRAEDELLLSTDAAVSQQQPAGLLHDVSSVASTSPSTIEGDLSGLWASVRDGEPGLAAFITSQRGAVWLASLHESGETVFPDVTPMGGGSIFGVPLVISRAAGSKLILIDSSELAVSDDGLVIDTSKSASVQMDSAPSGAAQQVSAFQTDLVFVRLTRYLYWLLMRPDAIGYLELPIGTSPS